MKGCEMNEKKWTDDERDEAFDRGMETMQRVALELYRRGREPLLEELETVKRERDEARAKLNAEYLRHADAFRLAMEQIEHWQRRAEHAFDRGAKAMREACARWMSEREGISQWVYDDALSALPIPEEP